MEELMRFEEQNGPPCSVPEFGAIFMSNKATRKECIKRKLLGLPPGMANFVHHVKAGMILFLFEFEKRELHGVFQASSDGAMNIVPHAYNSTGKQFPAQVKFTQLWCCNPLREDEFRDAIKENYFSKYKFNFGLSKDQVYKLLSLFSLRKLKVQPFQKHFTSSDIPSNSTSKFRRLVDNDMPVMKNQLASQFNAHGHGRPISLTAESLHEFGRGTNDGRFATVDSVRDERNLNIDLGEVISAKSLDHSFVSEARMAPNDVRSSKVNNGSNGYGESNLSMYLGSEQCNSYVATYTHNSDAIQAESSIHNQFKIPVPPVSMGLQVSESSCLLPPGDANITSNCPYDPDSPGINYWPSSSEANQRLNPVSGSGPSPSSNSIHMSPSVRNQPMPSSVEPVGRRRSSDVKTGFESSYMPLSGTHHDFSIFTGGPLSGTAFLEHVEQDISRNVNDRDIPCSETTGRFMEYRNSDGMNKSPSYNPSIVPSFVLSDRSSLTLEERHNHEAFGGNASTMKQDYSQPWGHGSTADLDCRGHDYNPSNNVDYKSFRNMKDDGQKSRVSVFSRLGRAAEAHMKVSDTANDHYEDFVDASADDFVDASADDIMSMLHRSHYQWAKKRNCTQSPLDKTTRKKRKDDSKLLIEQDISMEMVVDNSAETEDNNEENDETYAGQTPFVDFKRRKSCNADKKTSSCNEDALKVERDGQPKRRKLIRPDFSKIELPDTSDRYIEAHIVSNCRGEVGPCGKTSENADSDGKELSVADNDGKELSVVSGSGNMQVSVSPEGKSCEADKAINVKHTMLGQAVDSVSPGGNRCEADKAIDVKKTMSDQAVQDLKSDKAISDQAVQDLKSSNQTNMQQSSLETHGKTLSDAPTERPDSFSGVLRSGKKSILQGSSPETGNTNDTVNTSSETESCCGNKELFDLNKPGTLDGETETNWADLSSYSNLAVTRI